jgi:hypothetical protein
MTVEGFSTFRLADEQMDVFGHDDIADDHEVETLANLFEDFEEQVAPARTCQPGLAMITTTGERVEIVVAGVALETGGHLFTVFEGARNRMEGSEKKSCSVRVRESHPCKVRKGGPPTA